MEKEQRSNDAVFDKGYRGWVVVCASFLCNGLIFGIINTYSVVYIEFYNSLERNGVTDAPSKAALVGSLAIGTTFLLSPVSGVIIDRIGIQMTTFIGGAIAATGLFLSSFFTEKVELLYLTYGVLFGLGSSLMYTPSLAILGHYFRKYLGLVNGLVTAGSSLSTVIMPFVVDALLKNFGLVYCLRVEALMLSFLMLTSFAFKPVYSNKKDYLDSEEAFELKAFIRKLLNIDIWREKKFIIWVVTVPLGLFGYFVPYVHLVKFVADRFPNEDGKWPVVAIAVSSGVGRLIFGKLSDSKRINRIFLQQMSFVMIGVLTMLMVVTDRFSTLLLISLGMGIFDGCFISVLGPIAFDLCGQQGATQAIGFLLGFCSFPLTIGPPIAGLLYNRFHSYTLPFVIAGIPPILSAIAMSSIYAVKDKKNRCGSQTAVAATPPEVQQLTVPMDHADASLSQQYRTFIDDASV